MYNALLAAVCNQMTFPDLRHRHGLSLPRPAVLLGEGRQDTRERRKSSLLLVCEKQVSSYQWKLKNELDSSH